MPLYDKNRNTLDLGKSYLDHVSAMTVEDLHRKSDIAAELAYRDNLIAELRAALERYTQLSESGESIGEALDLREENAKLRAENEKLRAELDKVRKDRDEAYERAARVCEERGRQVGGAIDPKRSAAAIRALKDKP